MGSMQRALLVTVLVLAWLVACGSSGDGSRFLDGSNGGSNGGGTSSGFNTSSGGTSGDPGTASSLRIDPPSATITATGSLGALQGTTTFRAFLDNSPTPVAANWSSDDAGIGTIDTQGVF